MKLLRFGPAGAERVGAMDSNGTIRDLSSVIDELGPEELANNMEQLKSLDLVTYPAVDKDCRLGMPVTGAGKVVCVGLNYIDHARESGMPIPSEPVLFMKSTTSLQGPDDDVILPRNYLKADWEVELGIVIGKRASYIELADGMDPIAGFCIVNDLSERQFQLEREGQWVKGKSCDHFGPIGPYLVTPDSVDDINSLGIWLELDGERIQASNTSNMIFKVDQLVSYISQFMTLLPGDIICTGTPPGVGLGMDPQRWLQPGETMRLGIDGMGVQTQKVLAPQ